MADQIRVLIVDDIPETRDHLSKLLGFESGHRGRRVRPRPGARPSRWRRSSRRTSSSWTSTCRTWTASPRRSGWPPRCPTAAVVMMSVQGEADYLRRSMLAGAREFLVKPFSSDELTASIRQVYTREQEKQSPDRGPAGRGRRGATPPRPATGEREDGEPGRVVAVFGPKGGVGRTTLAVNLAVAAATELGQRTCLVDASFQFGDVGVLLNLNPQEQVDRGPHPASSSTASPSPSTPSSSTTRRASRCCSPRRRPEMAELITPAGAKRMLEALRDDARPRRRRLHVDLQRHDPRDPRPGGHRPHDAVARDHVDQEHPPLPRGGGAAGLRARTRSGSSSTAPIRRWASASRTSSTRSGGASTTRSSPTAGASSTPSTGACRSSSAIARRRCPRTSCGSLRRWSATDAGGRRRARPRRPPRRSHCSRGDDAADARSWPYTAEGE